MMIKNQGIFAPLADRIFPRLKLAASSLMLLGGLGLSLNVEAREPVQATVDILQPAQLREDFRQLYQGLQSAHIDLYANRAKADLDRAFAATLESFNRPMPRADAQLAFQRFVAEGRVAHARIDAPMEKFGAYLERGGRLFPFAVRILGDRLYVAENLSGVVDIKLGDEIVAIDGKPSTYWLAQLRRQISADSADLANAILEPQFTVTLWFERGEVDEFQTSFVTRDGRHLSLPIQARTPSQMREAASTSPAVLEIDPSTREAKMVGRGIAYLRPGVFMNTDAGADPFDPKSFHAFIDASFERFVAEGATHLLIDLRNNPGGDNSFSDYMIAWFADRPFRFASKFRVKVSREAISANTARLAGAPAGGIVRQYAEAYAKAKVGSIIEVSMPMVQPRTGQRFNGRVFVLVNRHSFSNAVSVAAIVQDYRFGTIIGEPTVDLATTFGAMETFQLPNSGIKVGFPKAHIIRPNGDQRLNTVQPEMRIKTPIVETADDQVLTAAFDLIANGK